MQFVGVLAMITDNKRAFKRASFKFRIEYCSHNINSANSGVSISENISLGGAYFICLHAFNIGEVLDIKILIPKSKITLNTTARVVRSENLENKIVSTFGVAVEFVDFENNSISILKSLLEK